MILSAAGAISSSRWTYHGACWRRTFFPTGWRWPASLSTKRSRRSPGSEWPWSRRKDSPAFLPLFFLDFGDFEDELLQLDANRRYWAKRLEELREELKTEPDRIEDLYTVKARRVEPVGLVYLLPITG